MLSNSTTTHTGSEGFRPTILIFCFILFSTRNLKISKKIHNWEDWGIFGLFSGEFWYLKPLKKLFFWNLEKNYIYFFRMDFLDPVVFFNPKNLFLHDFWHTATFPSLLACKLWILEKIVNFENFDNQTKMRFPPKV